MALFPDSCEDLFSGDQFHFTFVNLGHPALCLLAPQSVNFSLGWKIQAFHWNIFEKGFFEELFAA